MYQTHHTPLHNPVHRALCTYSSVDTGEIKVKIPSILGEAQEVSISYIGRSASNGTWAVPKVGDQIIVTADDENFTNVFWVQVDPYNPGTNEPTGLSNKDDSVIAFDTNTRTFTIGPTQSSYELWIRSVKHQITGTQSVTIPDVTGLYFIYFDPGPTLKYRTDYFEFAFEAPVSYVYWRADIQQLVFFADERHGITLDWQTHEYLHRTRGAAFARGFDLAVSTLSGNGSQATHMQMGIGLGTFFDEDLQVDIVPSASPTPNTWEQRLANPAYMPIFYRDAGGWRRETATTYIVKQGTTHPKWNNGTALAEHGANKYGISWVVATNNISEPVIVIMGQAEYSNISGAEAANWGDVNLQGLPIVELRPLYKVIFQSLNATYQGAIRKVMDLKEAEQDVTEVSLTSLESLTDVILTAPAKDDVLAYDGVEWTNSPQVRNLKYMMIMEINP